MSARKFCAALGTTALVASGLAFAAMAPASADPASTPGLNDFVGVGSDTTQFVVTDLINGATVNGSPVPGYNAGVSSGSPKMASWDACTVPSGKLYPCTPGSATDPTQFITLRTGAAPIARPNGSGKGKDLLHSTTDNPAVTFARSSGGLSDTEVSDGLVAYPFAVDTLVTVTAPNSNAPASLTGAQVLGIYNGTYTNWNEVGGKSGLINPLQPQSGSGTLKFFTDQLKLLNNNQAVTSVGKDTEYANSTTGAPCAKGSANCVQTSVQEHDPTLITHDPNAIAPFSLGRANLAGPSSVKVLSGFSPQRALYNVLRSKDSGNTGKPDNVDWFAGTSDMNSIFGQTGFICSAAARPLIENEGFKQLKSLADGGSCGSQVTTTSAPALDVYDADGVASSVTAAVTGASYGVVHKVSVKVTGAGGTPTGKVNVNIGSFTGQGTLSNGIATVTAPATLAAGTYDAAVVYLGDSNFKSGTADVALRIAKARTAASETFASKSKKGARKLKGTVKVTSTPSVSVSGPVTILEGRKKIATGTLSKGVARVTISLRSLKKGKNKLTISYKGTSNLAGTTKAFTITRK